MNKLLVCIDGSPYAEHVLNDAAWAALRLGAAVELLHVLPPHAARKDPYADYTGAIGPGARGELLEELTSLDEELGRVVQRRGRLILEHAERLLQARGVEHIELVYRRGALAETVQALQADADMIFMGKRGEHADERSEFMGSNLEKVDRLIHKPLYAASVYPREKNRFMIAYDGKENARKAVAFAASSSLLRDLECRLYAAESKPGEIDLEEPAEALRTAGFSPQVVKETAPNAETAIADYVKREAVDLLLVGAYSHSRLRTLFLGSATSSLVKSCPIPLILFR